MKCLFDHNWGWPRKRGDKDMQVCLNCGLERQSKVHFDGPRYHKTQEAIPNFAPSTVCVEAKVRRLELVAIRSAAA